jgi:hypothetical protein
MTRSRNALLLGAIAAGAVAVPAVAAATASSSHATLWEIPSGKAVCGQDAHPAKDLLCSAKNIPAPPHTTNQDGDPGFVTLGGSGKPTLIRTSQYSFKNPSDKFTKLAAGTSWSLNGVTCTIATSSVTCKNGSGHGFTAGSGKYKSF